MRTDLGINHIEKAIGSNLRRVRESREMSQSRAAELCSITCQQYQKYEYGTSRVAASRLVVLAQIFNTDISEFFRED